MGFGSDAAAAAAASLPLLTLGLGSTVSQTLFCEIQLAITTKSQYIVGSDF